MLLKVVAEEAALEIKFTVGRGAGELSQDNVMWIEKYRPKTLNEVVNQKETVEGIKALLKTPATMPHFLFAGPPGTGKSTVALCVARHLMGDNFRSLVLELNASDERGIGVVRERIKGFSQIIQSTSSGVQFGLVILDESDEMTKDAQTALRRIMETSSRTCRFILVCNYQSGIIEPIQSRCSVFRFRQLEEAQAVEHLTKICKTEGIEADPKAVKRIFELSEGDLRRAINYLQVAATSSKGGKLDLATLDKIIPEAENELIRDMLKLAIQGEFMKSRDVMYELMGKHGVSGREIIRAANRQIGRIPEITGEKQAEVVRTLGECDFRLTQGANEDIQISAMLAQLSLIGRK
jgi:replication factor C small subunit